MIDQVPHARRFTVSRTSVASALSVALLAFAGTPALARSAEAQEQMDRCQARAMATTSVIGSAALVALGPAGSLVASAGVGAGGAAAGQAAGTALCKDPELAAARKEAVALAKLENAVVRAPRDAGHRADLGQAYLKAGRFTSAAAALGDAVSLGDKSARTHLALALSQIAIGQTRDAVATLDDANGLIPAGDLGLALALAGETGRGVSLLTDAVRSGAASPKLRQNLAYAYALDGRWTEARLTASVDVPADQLNARLEQWAMSMRAGAEHERVATLLAAPVREDAGMPIALALNGQPVAAPKLAEVAPPTPAGELPAVPDAKPVQTVAMISAPVFGHGESTEAPTKAETASVPAAEGAPLPEPAPAVEPAPARVLAMAEPAPAPAPAPIARPAHLARPMVVPAPRQPATSRVREASAMVAANGNRAVQLGAFSSAQNAQRAVAFYTAHKRDLSGHKLVVTQARVNGRDFWRVAVNGLDEARASNLCSSLRRSGSACFAYAVRPAGKLPADKPVRSLALADRR